MTNRHAVSFVAGIVFLVLATTASQCSKVVDPAKQGLGLDLAGGVADCVRECNADAAAARASEQDLHVANVQACGDDPECLASEEARHTAVMEQIALDEVGCKAACHNQGGVGGGE